MHVSILYNTASVKFIYVYTGNHLQPVLQQKAISQLKDQKALVGTWPRRRPVPKPRGGICITISDNISCLFVQ